MAGPFEDSSSHRHTARSVPNRFLKLAFLQFLAVAALALLSLVFGKAFFGEKVHSVRKYNYTSPAVPTTKPETNVTVTQHAVIVSIPEPVVFALIVWSKDSAIEASLLIKTILIYNTMTSDIYIICDDDAESVLRTRLALVTRPSHHTRVWFHKPSWQSMLDRIEREGTIQSDHSAGLPGLMKLFIQEILPPSVKKVIYVDTDALFIADPSLLWNVFDTLKPSTSIVMASHPDQHAPEWQHASRICSCVMLLDLEQLLSSRLMDSSIYHQLDVHQHHPALSPDAFIAKYGLPGGDGNGRYDNVRLGDQGYWWAIVDYRPDIFEPLNYDFEVTSCLLDTYLVGLGDELITEEDERSRQIHTKHTPQEGKTILPKLLHFNCLHGTPVYTEWPGWSDPTNPLTIRWGTAVSYHAGYKWIWLNQGLANGTDHTLEMFTNRDVTFADELFLRHYNAKIKHRGFH